jgi:hypothetical protein
MHAIANPLRPAGVMHRISRLIADAARAMLLRLGRPQRGGRPGRQEAPKPPRTGLADELGEDNQLI